MPKTQNSYSIFNPPVLALLALSLVLFAFPNFVKAENLSEREFCNATIQRLALESESTEPPDTTGCIQMENILNRSTTWPEFTINFNKGMTNEAFPSYLGNALAQNRNRNQIEAFIFADKALINSTQIFARFPNDQRRSTYLGLILELRNSFLEPILNSGFDRHKLRSSYNERVRETTFNGLPSQAVLICLLMNDPLIGDFQKIIDSKSFNKCLQK